MKIQHQTKKGISAVPCPTCGVAAGKRCVLIAGGPRNEPHWNRRIAAADVVEKEEDSNSPMRLRNVPFAQKNRREKKSDAAFLALIARVRKELARPLLTKSVRERRRQRDRSNHGTQIS